MSRIAAWATGGFGVLVCAGNAYAADPAESWRPPPPEYVRPAPRAQELLSGWYLRGDLGYNFNNVGSVSAPAIVTGAKYNNAIDGTIGWGYKYNWFRGELSIDRGVPSKMSIDTTAAGNQPQYSAKVGSLSMMANAYFDMGTWWGFTPYIGGGAGVSQLKSSTYSDTTQPGGVVAYDGSIVTEPGKAINFSWAAMAGVAYQVAPNWMIDVGYRYMSLGDLPSVHGAGATNNAPVFKNLTSQEVRMGVRFLFD